MELPSLAELPLWPPLIDLISFHLEAQTVEEWLLPSPPHILTLAHLSQVTTVELATALMG